MSQTQCDHHLAFVSCDPTTDLPDYKFRTPCERCQHPGKNWFCLSCKVVLCFRHSDEHYQQTKHCICVHCCTKSIWCCSCKKNLDAQLIQQLRAKCRSSSTKLETIDATVVDAIDILSKPFPSINIHPQLEAQSVVNQDELALAKEGIQKIFHCGLKALADPKVQEEFLLYSASLLSANSFPSELSVNLSSFRCNLSEVISSFIKAQDELKVASDLSAMITLKKFVVRQQTSKYDKVKKEMTASEEKVANYKSMIKELEAEIKRMEACLASEESNREKIDEAVHSIETKVTTARDGLVLDMAQVSSMVGTIQAANQLVTRTLSDWDNLETSFTKFATVRVDEMEADDDTENVSHHQKGKINCNSAMLMKGQKKTQCTHLQVSVSCELTDVPSPPAPCIRCREPDTKRNSWFCLSCKEVLCNKHCLEHYDQTKHCIFANCRTKAIGCCACKEYLDAQVIVNLMLKSRSTSSKLEKIDAIIVGVVDLLSKPFRSINVHPMLDAQPFADQNELALTKEGLRRIFNLGLKALADPKLQEEFLLYSATVLATESCPLELKVNLSSFTSKLSEDTSAFVKAQDELKVASQLSASITQKKVALWQQTSKYAKVKKEIVASDEKVANYKAIIKELEAEIKMVEARLATEESNRKKIDEIIDSIETQVATARDELVSDMALVSSMDIDGTTKEANQLVFRKTSDWDKLKTSFTKFATAALAPVAQDCWDHALAPASASASAWDWDQIILEMRSSMVGVVGIKKICHEI